MQKFPKLRLELLWNLLWLMLPKKGRNPQTGEPLKIKARNAVTFKAGKKLKDAV
jgi:hypothetical protein